MTLTDEHIEYIRRDLHYRGIVDESIDEELIDHICSMTEEQMQQGSRFIEAYRQAIAGFGSEEELQRIQVHTIQFTNNNTRLMLRNYLKIAYRNLVKHRFYSAINIIGLSIGVACSLLIFLYVYHESTYDRFHRHADRIYRTSTHAFYGGHEFNFATAPAPLASVLREEVPEVEEVVRFRTRGSVLARTPDMPENFKESRVIFADSGFFNLFTFPLIEGSPETALNTDHAVAISQSTARKYYPSQPALGRTLLINGDQEYTIKAVFKDMPAKSHLQYDLLLSMASMEAEANNMMWVSNNFYTYVRLRPHADKKVADRKIAGLLEKYLGPQIEDFTGDTYAKFIENGNYEQITLQPLERVYLYSDYTFDIGRMGNATYIRLFAAVAIFIIFLACINFMNLSTARSANRAREVGVRKVLGSYRSHLIRQFLAESILMTLLAVALGVGLVMVVLPAFNHLAGMQLILPTSHPLFLVGLTAGALILGVIAGLYPAVFLSSFKPINALKGKRMGAGNNFIRSGLVVFQFFIGILLITCTYAIYQQLHYMQTKQVGFDKEQTILIYDAYSLGEQLESFKKEVNQLSAVRSSSYSSFLPVSGYARNDNTYWEEGKMPTDDNVVSMQMWTVDSDYLKTLGIRLVSGRDFNRDLPSDSTAIILNEEAAARLHVMEDPERQIESYGFNPENGETIPDQIQRYHVIGVMQDFHYENMKKSIGPLAMKLGRSSGVMSVRLSTTDFKSSVDQIEALWKKMAPSYPFNYQFLDEEFGNMYSGETRLAEIFTLFTSLAVLIGCLGLFALASYMAEQRTKEIGIRKVMGASVRGIVILLSKDFTRLVLIAFVLATPVAWYGIHHWLAEYNYRITIGWQLFAVAGVLAFGIALLTVLYQSLKAASSNPVESLRSE